MLKSIFDSTGRFAEGYFALDISLSRIFLTIGLPIFLLYLFGVAAYRSE